MQLKNEWIIQQAYGSDDSYVGSIAEDLRYKSLSVIDGPGDYGDDLNFRKH